MGNCLVTKLNGTVDNDNLKVYNSVTLLATNVAFAGNGYLNVQGDKGGKIIIKNGAGYTNEARTEGYASEFDIPNDNFSIWVTDGSCKIIVVGIYGITKIDTGDKISIAIEDLLFAKNGIILGSYNNSDVNSNFIGDIDSLSNRETGGIVVQKLQNTSILSFKNVKGNVSNINKFSFDTNGYSKKLSIRFANSDIRGDISVFASFNNSIKENTDLISTGTTNVGKLYGNVESFVDYVNMEMFDLNYITLTGNLATALGGMIRLSLIAVGGHKVAEDLKNLFDTLYANGKTSGSIVCWMGSNKTLNGGTWVDGSTVTFSASGWVVNS